MPSHRNLVVAVTMFAGAAALATAALASGPKLSDAQYLAAAHCQGLYNSHALGSADSSAINALMKSEGAYRSPEVADRADEARSQAMSSASHAGAGTRSELISERDGACQVWAKSGDTSTGGH
jgi:hypothetical protein